MPEPEEKKGNDGDGGNPPKPDDKGSPGTPPANGEHMIPKARLDEVIAERNALRAAEEARKEADRKAADQKAKDDGKLQELIDARDAEIATLKATAARFDALVETLTPQIDAESKDWPEEVKDMLAMGQTIEQKFAILPKARALAARLANGGQTPPPGTGDKPKPKGGPATADAQKLAKSHVMGQRSYNF